MRKLKQTNAITLVALVITIIILLILAGISIQAITNQGLFGRAKEARIATKIAQLEEYATLRVYELYTENINNLDNVNDATIKTAVLADLESKGYNTKNLETTSETVKGLKIQDSTGQNNFDSISLLQQKNTTIKVGLNTETQLISSKIYVEIDKNWYELIIKDKTVKISREQFEEPTTNENTYEIKINPPSSGIIMKVAGEQINSETAITSETLIEIQAGNSTGTFPFTVKETKSSVTRNVNINVTADPTYATSLNIAANDGKTEIIPGGTLQLVATKTPITSTDTVSWKIESGDATVDTTGLVTASKNGNNATVGSTITVSATCNRKDGTTSTVEKQTLTITVKSAGESVGEIVNDESKVGYYVDIDGDYEPDGVIYADLAVGGTGQWGHEGGKFEIPTETNLNEYYIVSTSYEGPFGNKPVIRLKNSRGIERFYVMALEDFGEYNEKFSFDEQRCKINFGVPEDFGYGKQNTETLINYFENNPSAGSGWMDGDYEETSGSGSNGWTGNDIWYVLGNEYYDDRWFVPSKGEWCAFAENLKISYNEDGGCIRYEDVGLKSDYWSSSQPCKDYMGNKDWTGEDFACSIDFYSGGVYLWESTDRWFSVRMSMIY